MFVSSDIKILLVLFITTLHIDAYFNWQMMGQVENSSSSSYFMQILKSTSCDFYTGDVLKT